jgi:hypothetical protein
MDAADGESEPTLEQASAERMPAARNRLWLGVCSECIKSN